MTSNYRWLRAQWLGGEGQRHWPLMPHPTPNQPTLSLGPIQIRQIEPIFSVPGAALPHPYPYKSYKYIPKYFYFLFQNSYSIYNFFASTHKKKCLLVRQTVICDDKTFFSLLLPSQNRQKHPGIFSTEYRHALITNSTQCTSLVTYFQNMIYLKFISAFALTKYVMMRES